MHSHFSDAPLGGCGSPERKTSSPEPVHKWRSRLSHRIGMCSERAVAVAPSHVLRRNATANDATRARTLVEDQPLGVGWRTGWCHVGTAPLYFKIRGDWMSALRPHSAAFVASNDARSSATRAATRGRIAREGGDEYADVRARSSASVVNWIERQNQLIVEGSADERMK